MTDDSSSIAYAIQSRLQWISAECPKCGCHDFAILREAYLDADITCLQNPLALAASSRASSRTSSSLHRLSESFRTSPACAFRMPATPEWLIWWPLATIAAAIVLSGVLSTFI